MDSNVGESFRPIRLTCELTQEGKRWTAVTRSLGTARVEVQTAPGAAMPAVGSSVRLCLADGAEGTAEVEWVVPARQDLAGRPCATVGLRVSEAGGLAEVLATRLSAFRHTVLVVDGNAADRDRASALLSGEFEVVACATAKEALEAVEARPVAVLLCDQRLPGMAAVELFARVAERIPGAPLLRVMASAYTKAEDIQGLVNDGRLFHYLRKPLVADELRQVIRRAADAYALAVENERLRDALGRANERLRSENAHLRARLGEPSPSAPFVGRSAAIRRVYEDLVQVRDSDVSVHLTGETGTGKELAARVLHHGSARESGPFVAFNCAGMPDTLVHAALFGHRRGAFTGADRDRPGVFQEANGGTLLLDEVGELSSAAQAALLRVLQAREVLPLGATRPERVSVRIVSATHQDLLRMVQERRFREDLYFRLVVLHLHLAPLRERVEDVAPLAAHFLALQASRHGKALPGFTRAALEALEAYRWPGNVRELENEIERAAALARPARAIDVELLSPRIRGDGPTAPAPATPYDEALENLSRSMIQRALAEAGGVVARAAEALGIERTRLVKLRQRLNL